MGRASPGRPAEFKSSLGHGKPRHHALIIQSHAIILIAEYSLFSLVSFDFFSLSYRSGHILYLNSIKYKFIIKLIL